MTLSGIVNLLILLLIIYLICLAVAAVVAQDRGVPMSWALTTVLRSGGAPGLVKVFRWGSPHTVWCAHCDAEQIAPREHAYTCFRCEEVTGADGRAVPETTAPA
jgi:hypothetical protein